MTLDSLLADPDPRSRYPVLRLISIVASVSAENYHSILEPIDLLSDPEQTVANQRTDVCDPPAVRQSAFWIRNTPAANQDSGASRLKQIQTCQMILVGVDQIC